MPKKRLLSIAIVTISLLFLVACGSPSTPTATTTPTFPTSTLKPTPTTISSPTPTAFLQELEVHFIDVGQGDSILVDLGETEVLIDGGDRLPGVVSYLSGYVDGDIEVMVATHPHADHIGGLIAVLDTFTVDEIWLNGDTSTSATYKDFMERIERRIATGATNGSGLETAR